jgi:hypothetical protein
MTPRMPNIDEPGSKGRLSGAIIGLSGIAAVIVMIVMTVWRISSSPEGELISGLVA